MSYKAIIAELTNVRDHPNADKLKLATVLGNQIVVGLDYHDGQKIIYFPTDGLLSDEFCEKNELFPIKDAEGNRIGGGYFTPGKARVRAQNFRGQKSDGFVTSIDSLAYTGFDLNKLEFGVQFDELKGHKICEKYFSPATLKAIKGQKKLRKANVMFPKHVDTEQWAYNKDMVQDGSVAYVTEKIHGTSQRVGQVLVDRPLRWWEKLLGREPRQDWDFILGTRNVVLSNESNGGFYGTDEFRYASAEPIKGNLRDGEIIYGEVVGWVNEQTPIMPTVSTKDLRKAEWFKEIFDGKPPKEISYKYSCPPGSCEFYVYRIAHAHKDGHLTELSWPQVRARCSELGIKHVPDVAVVLIDEFTRPRLTEIMEEGLDKLSSIDHSHIQEGLCVRLEQPDGTVKILKNKSASFKILEGIMKSDDAYVDLEESS